MLFCDYLYHRNGDAVRGFLRSLGYRFEDRQGRQVLDEYIRSRGEKAVEQLLPLHPDYHLLISSTHGSMVATPATTSVRTAPMDTVQTVLQPGLPDYQRAMSQIINKPDALEDLKRIALILFCIFLFLQIVKS